MGHLEITGRNVGDVTVLNLKGRMIFEEGDTPFRDHVDALVATGRTKLVLDLAGVTYIDSAGLGMLVAKYVSLHRQGGDIKLLHPTARCEELMRITHLSDVFETYPSEEAAVKSFTVDSIGAQR
jgi:anti-sigma B factor antagonist